MSYLKYILLILVFIITIKANFGVSNAFLGDDLGLNLYKNIDRGLGELESAEFSYEMKGQKKSGAINDQINKILKNKGYGDCKIKTSITKDEVKEITTGNLRLLSKKLSEECSSNDKISISTLNGLQNHIVNFQNITTQNALEKSIQTYDISRIGLYYDGDTVNSPFDIIQDIKDIDHIVFTQPIEYEGETPINDGGFTDYLKGKFRDTQNKWNNKLNDKINPPKEGEEINEKDLVDIEQTEINNIDPLSSGIFGNDQTQYSCPQNGSSSGLSQDYLDILLGNNQDHEETSGSIFDEINGEQNSGFGNTYDEIIDEEIALLDTGYQNISDDRVWKCTSFFCITVEFITHKHSLFGDEKMRSIQSIIEKSNEHLKKFANSSLIQSKMTTNNFELGLRGFNLSDIFSFGLVVTKKTPPILNLEGFFKDKKTIDNNNPLSLKSLLCKRWEAQGYNCERENDLTIFIDQDAEEKTVVDSGELTTGELPTKSKSRKIFLQEQSLIDDYISKAIQRDAQINETNELYEEFLELERFVGNMEDYSYDLNALVHSMIEIPIHP